MISLWGSVSNVFGAVGCDTSISSPTASASSYREMTDMDLYQTHSGRAGKPKCKGLELGACEPVLASNCLSDLKQVT